MIILDTNVLSELMKSIPNSKVEEWVNGYSLGLLYLTSISIMEIQLGIGLLPDGKKKEVLKQSFEEMTTTRFKDRILGFDSISAIATAQIASLKKKQGFNIAIQDLQIAGIALANNAVIATRNEKDFLNCEVEVINPWK